MKKVGLTLILLILAAAVLYAFRLNGRRPAAPEETVRVLRGDLIVKEAETGSLEPINVVEIKSEQAGEVKRLYIHAGDTVKAGQPLATIQQESNQARKVAEVRAAIEQERLNLEEAEREWGRAKELFEKGFISRKEMESSEKAKENAKIKHDLAKRQLLLTLGGNRALYEKYLQRDLNSREVDEFTIDSPLSGTVIEVDISEGEIVSSGATAVSGGTTLMRIADLSKMWVKTKINEVNIGRIQVGQPVEVRLDAVPDQVYRGSVVKISPKGEKVNNIVTYEVTIELMNSDQRLMPSMTANIDILTRVEKDVLTLPLNALEKAEGKERVLYRSPTGERQFRAVEVGAKNETMAVIRDGLQEGDLVVIPRKGVGGRGPEDAE